MKRLIGPSWAHYDAPCTDACYKEECSVKTFEILNAAGEVIRSETSEDVVDVSDGDHTFTELYTHRRALTAALAAVAASVGDAWRSKAHHPADDPIFDGYFIVGINVPTTSNPADRGATITYHYELEHWDDFLACPELAHAPKWDGATPNDTVDRLLTMAHAAGQAIDQMRQDGANIESLMYGEEV